MPTEKIWVVSHILVHISLICFSFLLLFFLQFYWKFPYIQFFLSNPLKNNIFTFPTDEKYVILFHYIMPVLQYVKY